MNPQIGWNRGGPATGTVLGNATTVRSSSSSEQSTRVSVGEEASVYQLPSFADGRDRKGGGDV